MCTYATKVRLMDDCECMWRIAGEPGSEDAVGEALSRSRATLWYGSRCVTYSRTRDAAGNHLLRLRAVGHLVPTGLEAPVLMLSKHGSAAQQSIAPDGEREGAEVAQRLGRALFAEVARTLDLEAARRS